MKRSRKTVTSASSPPKQTKAQLKNNNKVSVGESENSEGNSSDTEVVPKKNKLDLMRFKNEAKQKIKSVKQEDGSQTLMKKEAGEEPSGLQLKRTRKKDHIKVETESVVADTDHVKDENDTSVTSSSTLKVKVGTIPDNWELVLQNLRKMLQNSDSNSMEANQNVEEIADTKDKRYETLVSLMISSRTKDAVTDAAMLRLREHGCTVANILSTSDEILGQLIYPVSFWKNKVKFLRKTTEILRDQYNGDIPSTVEDLCKLHGVGLKVAHLCMRTAWGQVTGIAADTHVHRVANRLGWVKTKTPEETRKALEGWVVRELWAEMDDLLVDFGQQICQSQKPRCATCLNYDICPFGSSQLKGKKPKKVK